MAIDKLYNLIINNTNKEEILKELKLWKEFYDNLKDIFKNNLDNDKFYTVLEFLYQNPNSQIFKEYANHILSNLIAQENTFCRDLGTNINATNFGSKCYEPQYRIEVLLNNLDNHNKLSKLLDYIELSQVSYIKDNTAKFKSSQLKRDTLVALINIIFENLIKLEPKLVKKVIEYIDKETLLLIEKKDIFHGVDEEELITEYLTKFLAIKRYTGQDIKNGSLTKKLLYKEIDDKRIIKNFIERINIENLNVLLNSNFQVFVDILNSVPNIEEREKRSYLGTIINAYQKEDYIDVILKYYIISTDEEIKKIIRNKSTLKKALNITPVKLSPEVVIYLLDNNYHNSNFIYNLNELVNSPQQLYSKEEKEIIKQKIEQLEYEQDISYSFYDSIKILNDYFNNNIDLTFNQAREIIKTITKYVNEYMKLENVEVYFSKSASDEYKGQYLKDDGVKAINIKSSMVDKILNKRSNLSERTRIFLTIFHELRHHKQYCTKTPNSMYQCNMRKERYLQKYDKEYYSKNYDYVYEEIDARASSYNMLQKFFEKHFPHLLNELQDQIIINLKKEKELLKKKNEEKKVTVVERNNIDFNLAFDILIKYNINILDQEPIFNLEYNQDGTIKTEEELLNNITTENEDIIKGILKNRYQYTLEQTLSKNNTK